MRGIIEKMRIKNKRGITTLSLILIIFLSFFLLVMMGMLSFGMNQVDESFLSIDFEIGNFSWNESYQETLQPGIIAMETTVPRTISIGVLLGMIITMLIVGFKIKKVKEYWAIIDIGIIIVAQIFSVVIRDLFVEYMNISPEFLAIYRDTLPEGAKFILNFPVVIPIIGIIIMGATYFVTKDREEEEIKDF